MRRRQVRRYRSSKMGRQSARLIRSARHLGRQSKQLIMLAADVVAIPAALWTAIFLRTGNAEPHFGALAALYAGALLTTVPMFVRLGLYRAVVRFLGSQAAGIIALST
ncbi:MAG TPA: hypothetical protein VMF52_04425, partial [Steroidobacteraceae bacterium]|nr:hypothetical protein [Steroidobacteraceae bacterium]